MTSLSGAEARRYGTVFDEVADEYDRTRPLYPDALVDRACEVAGLGSGDPVLEIGCGTGQLTRSLVARGLRVTAVEPGENLIRLAGQNLAGAGAGAGPGAGPGSGSVEFVHARFEDAALPSGYFRAVFSASALHWVDPAVGWRKIAGVLAAGGTLALLSYFGVDEPRSRDDQDAMLAAMARVAPDIAAGWPAYRDIDGTLEGVERRRGNVSEVWAWLGSYDMAQDAAARLFDDVQVALVPKLVEQTGSELNATFRTMSYYARLSPPQRAALAQECEAIYAHLGRPIRASVVTALVTARRT
jgi:ubiquinone/menaquinone biosynthesis C-methylase UbiE